MGSLTMYSLLFSLIKIISETKELPKLYFLSKPSRTSKITQDYLPQAADVGYYTFVVKLYYCKFSHYLYGKTFLNEEAALPKLHRSLLCSPTQSQISITGFILLVHSQFQVNSCD